MDAETGRTGLRGPDRPKYPCANIKVEFTGPITKEADTDGVVGHMIDRLKEVIATAPEGVPG